MGTQTYLFRKLRYRNNTMFMALAFAGMFLSSYEVQSQEANHKAKLLNDSSFVFSYKNASTILSPSFGNNRAELAAMDKLICDKKENIQMGKCYLSIIAYIQPNDLNNPRMINQASIQANVVRSYIKQRHHIDSKYSTFVFDTAHHVSGQIKIECTAGTITSNDNQCIFYNQTKDNNAIVQSVNRYRPIPVLGYIPVVEAKVETQSMLPLKEMEQIEKVLVDNTPAEYHVADSSKVYVFNDVTTTSVEKDVNHTPSEIQSSRLYRTVKRPIFAVKSNVLYWAGVTTEKKYQRATPNVELEYFFAKRWSVNADFAYVDAQSTMTINSNPMSSYKSGKYVEKWSLTAFGIEPRYWFKPNYLYSQFFAGVYAGAGDYDLQPNNMSLGGHGKTGHYKETGVSVGYYLPLTNRVGVEGGVRFGYRWLKGTDYVICKYNENVGFERYDYASDYTKNELKVTGIRLSVSYRFGNIKSSKGK